MKRSIQIFAVSALAAGIAACGGSSDGGTSTGSVSVGLTDAPIDNAEAVNIEVEALVLQSSDGDRLRYEFDFPQPLNLLELQGGAVEALIQDEEVPAGEYNWMRLELGDNNSIEVDTGAVIESFKLITPSKRGVQTSGFIVPAGGEVALTIDFDVRKSIVNPQNNPDVYKLKPVVRLVDNANVGTIKGTVTANLITQECGDTATTTGFIGNVYIHQGDVEPGELGSDNPPLTIAPLKADGEYTFTAAFLPAGTYTVSYTCDDDLIETDDGEPIIDGVTFTDAQPVSVEAKPEPTFVELDTLASQ